MSIELLKKLNGNKRGAFYRYLQGLEGTPRIAWYPSGGEDFRPLMLLSKEYSKKKPAKSGVKEPAAPELFLYTDYCPWTDSRFLDSFLVHYDPRTKVEVLNIEQLPDLDLPLDKGLVDFPEKSKVTGKVVFLEMKVTSKTLGELVWPVIYAFVENEAFAAKVLFPQKAKLSHIIQVRYGGGLGGAGTRGLWVRNVLKRLGCEVFVADDMARNVEEGKDEREKVVSIYPELGQKDQFGLKEFRSIPSESWSGHGEVTWNKVS